MMQSAIDELTPRTCWKCGHSIFEHFDEPDSTACQHPSLADVSDDHSDPFPPENDCKCPAYAYEHRDVTARGRAIRELVGEALDRNGVVVGINRRTVEWPAIVARAYDRGALDKSAELVAEFQAVIDKLRADITQDKPL